MVTKTTAVTPTKKRGVYNRDDFGVSRGAPVQGVMPRNNSGIPIGGVNWGEKIRNLGSEGLAKGFRTGDFGLTDAEREYQRQQVAAEAERVNLENIARRDAQAKVTAPVMPMPTTRPPMYQPGFRSGGGTYQIPDRNFMWQTTPMEQARLVGTMGRPDLSGLLSTGEYGPLAGQQYQYLDSGNTMINYGPGGGFGGWPGWGGGIGGGGGITPPGRGTDFGDPEVPVVPVITRTIDDGVDFTPRHIEVIDTDAGKVYVDTNTGAYGMKDATQIYDLDNEFLPNYSALYTDAGGGQFTKGPYGLEGPEAALSGFNALGQPVPTENRRAFLERIGQPYGNWSDDLEDQYIQQQTGRDYAIFDGNVITAGDLLDTYKGDRGRDLTNEIALTHATQAGRAANRLRGAPGLGQTTPIRQSRTQTPEVMRNLMADYQARQAQQVLQAQQQATATDSLRRALGFDTSYVAPPGSAAQPTSSFRSPTNVRAYTPSPDAGVKTRSRGRDLGEDTRIAQEVAAQRRIEATEKAKRDSARAVQKAEEAKAKAKKEKDIKHAHEAMKAAMKKAEQLRKDREFRAKQQKDKSHAFF